MYTQSVVVAMPLRRSILACSLTSALLASSSAVLAQSGQSTDVTDLDRITITAQSREQELQDVPITLHAVDANLLRDVNAENIKDLTGLVPGLVIDPTASTQPRVRMRGVENSDFGIGTDPAVGVFIDGIYHGATGALLLSFVDMERIEVLKGPQGTLFGRSTAAGAISMISRKPQPVTEARATMRLGNYGRKYADATLNFPTSERSALRINALVNRSDGWFRDAATGQDLGTEDTWATRAAWQVELGDNTTVLFGWDHEDMDQNGRVVSSIVNLPPVHTARPPLTPAEYIDPRGRPIFSDVDSFERRKYDAFTMMVDHELSWGRLSSSTSWRQFDTSFFIDQDATNRFDLYMDSFNGESVESMYQEFKFSGSNERLDWVAGASWYKENSWQRTDLGANSESVETIYRNFGITPFTLTSNLAQQILGLPVSLVGDPWIERFDNTLGNTSYAVFGDVIWKLNDRLNLTFGLRYSRDEKSFSWFNPTRIAPELDGKLDMLDEAGLFQIVESLNIPGLTPDVIGLVRGLLRADFAFTDGPAMQNKNQQVRIKSSWSDLSPRFVIDYHLNDDTMLFASLAKGYKPGGFNLLQIGPTLDSETVWNLETGIKQTLGRFFYNASIFHYRYDNRQSTRLFNPDPSNPASVQRFIIDTGDLKATGFDIDLRWKINNAFTVDAALAWIDSKYTRYTAPDGGAGIKLDGAPTGEPRVTTSTGIVYRTDVGGGELRMSARHSYRGARRCNAASPRQNDCFVSAQINFGEARNRTDFRASWLSPFGRWEWAAYVNNAFDNRYVRSLAQFALTMGAVGAAITEPRTYGMEVTMKF